MFGNAWKILQISSKITIVFKSTKKMLEAGKMSVYFLQGIHSTFNGFIQKKPELLQIGKALDLELNFSLKPGVNI